jgi:hypothetical protein
MKHLQYFEQIFERRNIGTIYHFTSLVNTFYIISNNELESYREIDEQIPKIYGRTPEPHRGTTFSFTRDKNLVKRIGQGQIDTLLTTRLDFDGTKLSDKYIIRPYNWQGDWEKEQLKKMKSGEDFIPNKKMSHEAEQVLITKENHLQNIQSYMLNIIIPSFETFVEEFEFYAESDPNFFYRLQSIVEMVGYEEFDEYDNEYDENMIRDTYNYIIETLDMKSEVPFKVGVVS